MVPGRNQLSILCSSWASNKPLTGNAAEVVASERRHSPITTRDGLCSEQVWSNLSAATWKVSPCPKDAKRIPREPP